jgi:hypothetical protein
VFFSFSLKTFANPAKQYGVGYSWERFDPAMAGRFYSVTSLVVQADYTIGYDKRHTLVYADYLDSLISERFYHAYSTYSIKENWIAYLAGKYIWYDLAAIVTPEDIMKHPMAACSQQAIILMNCFKEVGISYRAVHLKGHFATEGLIDGQWYYFDPSVEPNFKFTNGRKSLEELLSKDELHTVYVKELRESDVHRIFQHISYGAINENVAWKAALFHHVTYIASLLLPGFIFFAFIRFFRRKILRKRITKQRSKY